MKNALVVVGVVVVSAIVMISVLVGVCIGYHNSEVGLRNQFEAQMSINESSFDKMWKVIQQESQVANSERESFRKTFVEIMQNQQGIAGSGSLASFFSQAGVSVDNSAFLRLMNAIESQRESFHRDQIKLAEIYNAHKNVCTKFPGSLICGSRPPLQLKIVSSTKTKEIMSSGIDDKVDL